MVRRGKQELEALIVMTPCLIGVTNPHASDEITAKHRETFIVEVRLIKPRYDERVPPSSPGIKIRPPKVRFTCVRIVDLFIDED
jgi:hypothetical protein